MIEQDIPTPAIVIDVAQASQNVKRLMDYVDRHGLQFRPHTKTHKSAYFAKMQIDLGATGLTVAKVGEAEVMARVSEDVLMAYPVLDLARTTRAAKLARQVTLRVAIDSTHAADALADAARVAGSTIGILVDLDVGGHRTGVQTAVAALHLAQHVDRAKSLRLDGLFYYPGHVRCAVTEQAPLLQAVQERLIQTLDLWREHGLPARIVSGGSTPTQYQSHLLPATTEIRPGTSIFYDRIYLRYGYCTPAEIAAKVISTVVSNAVPGKAILDSGSKSLSSDRLIGLSTSPDFGMLEEYPEARISQLSEEHGEVDVTRCERVPRLGERVHLIPNHICTAINLHSSVYLKHDDGRIEQIPVDARGMLL